MCEMIKMESWSRKLRFPIHAGDDTVENCLKIWMEKFYANIRRTKELTYQDKETVVHFCDVLCEIVGLATGGKDREAEQLFVDEMNKVEENFWYTEIWQRDVNSCLCATYYRMNTPVEGVEFNEKTMLHIPIDKKSFARNYRFSTEGQPCSYMATYPAVAWYECGMPNKFLIQKYNPRFSATERLICLDLNPIQESNCLRKLRGDDLVDCVKKLSFTYPLMACCLVVVNKWEEECRGEYKLPQLLMNWIKKKEKLVGVRYISAANYSETRNWSGCNIALPVKNYDQDGYSTYMKQVFDISEGNVSEQINLAEAIKSKFANIPERLSEFYHEEKIKAQTWSGNDVIAVEKILDILTYLETFILNLELLLRTDHDHVRYINARTLSVIGRVLDKAVGKERYETEFFDEFCHSFVRLRDQYIGKEFEDVFNDILMEEVSM